MTVSNQQLPPRPSEVHAAAIARELPGMSVVCTTVGRAQTACEIAHERPQAAVTCCFFDLYQHDLALAGWETKPERLCPLCVADLPAGPYDLAVVPLLKNGEAEFTRELIQQAFMQLVVGGFLVTAIDNPRDTWLREQLVSLGEKVRVKTDKGSKPSTVGYVVEKTHELKKNRDFSCDVVFRDREHLLTLHTRPGVFAHRRLDPGARHLLNAVDVAPGTHVLDVGCGSGGVALGIAARDPSVEVCALDSSARAVECTRIGSKKNDLPNIATYLESGGAVPDPGTYDLVLANPPYYANFRIAELFVDAAWRALAPGGTLLVVTKRPHWYLEHLPQSWQGVAREEVKTYHLIEAVRPDSMAGH